MKIGRSVATAVATHSGKTIGENGGVHKGDINLGANKIKTTNLILKEKDSDRFVLRNSADDADRGIVISSLDVSSRISLAANALSINVPNTDDYYTQLRARDNANALVEVARLQGAADPYLQMTLPMVLAPAAIPGTLVEGHVAYVADDDKLAFYDGAAAQFLASNLIGMFAQLVFRSDDNIPQDTTAYLHPYSGNHDTTESIIYQVVAPVAGLLRNLYVEVSSDPGGGQSAVFTVRINGVDKTITCTIADAAKTGNDITHTEAVAAGDLISIKAVTSALATIEKVAASIALA